MNQKPTLVTRENHDHQSDAKTVFYIPAASSPESANWRESTDKPHLALASPYIHRDFVQDFQPDRELDALPSSATKTHCVVYPYQYYRGFKYFESAEDAAKQAIKSTLQGYDNVTIFNNKGEEVQYNLFAENPLHVGSEHQQALSEEDIEHISKKINGLDFNKDYLAADDPRERLRGVLLGLMNDPWKKHGLVCTPQTVEKIKDIYEYHFFEPLGPTVQDVRAPTEQQNRTRCHQWPPKMLENLTKDGGHSCGVIEQVVHMLKEGAWQRKGKELDILGKVITPFINPEIKDKGAFIAKLLTYIEEGKPQVLPDFISRLEGTTEWGVQMGSHAQNNGKDPHPLAELLAIAYERKHNIRLGRPAEHAVGMSHFKTIAHNYTTEEAIDYAQHTDTRSDNALLLCIQALHKEGKFKQDDKHIDATLLTPPVLFQKNHNPTEMLKPIVYETQKNDQMSM